MVVGQCPNTIPNRLDYGTGNMSITYLDGCLPLTIKVRNTLAGATNTLTLYDYKDGPLVPDSLKKDSVHTFKRPGTYTIVQLSEKEGRKLMSCQRVVVIDTLAPKARLIACPDGKVKLVLDPNQPTEYQTYWVDWGDGNIRELQEFQRNTSHQYTIPRSYTVKIWGVHRFRSCKGSTLVLKYDPQTPSTKPKIKELHTTSATSADLLFENPLGTELVLMRRAPEGAFVSTGLVSRKMNDQVKALIDSTTSVCFRIQATDTCLAETYRSDLACTPLLKLTGSPDHNQLVWKTFIPTGGNATIEVLKDGSVWKNVTSLGGEGQLIDQELTCGTSHCYQLRQSGTTGIVTSPIRCGKTPPGFCTSNSPLFIPAAFSPNNDGINDFFEIKGEVPPNYSISVFNQWGNLIFQSTDQAKSWDGKYRDTILPSGTYAYIIVLKDTSGKDYRRTGTVMLLK